MKIGFLFLAGLLPTSVPAWGSSQVGTVTQIQGDVKIFSHPSKTLQNGQGKPHALYEGEYFLVEEAKVGDSIENGNIVRTAPGAKARVVYQNGDQFHVGSGTAYRVFWNQETPQGAPKLDLTYGKIRGIIEKGGPRSRLQIRTRTAVMGVRGTDFFIAQDGGAKSTEVSIVRGAVEVAPKNAPAKPIKVSEGYSVDVGSASRSPQSDSTHAGTTHKESPTVEVRKTTQEDFIGIQKSSAIQPKPAQIAPTAELKKTIEVLEKKATETTLKDIKTSNPKLFASLADQKNVSVDDVNKAAIQTLQVKAPKAPEKHKPYKSELEDIEDGAYDKYFKHVD